MKESSLTGALDKHIIFLVDNSYYFGNSHAEGAIAYFERKYAADVSSNLAAGDASLAIHYLNILYSAMTFCAKKGFLYKFRIFLLLKKINEYVKSVRLCVTHGGKPLTASQLHVLMSINVRKLQILHMMYLQKKCWRVRILLLDEFYNDLHQVNILADKESVDGLHSLPSDLGPDNLILLMCQALMYEMSTLGIVDLPESPEIRQRIWLYATYSEKTTDRDIAQIVARLFRSIGHHNDAEKVARRMNNNDQIIKVFA